MNGSPENQRRSPEQRNNSGNALARQMKKMNDRYILTASGGKILRREYKLEDEPCSNWKSIMKEVQGSQEPETPNDTTKEQTISLGVPITGKVENQKENRGKKEDSLNGGNWNDKMNKLLFLQNFAQLLEKHGFKCENPNFMENNEFVQNLIKFFEKSGVSFPENLGTISIEEETQEVSDTNFNY